MKRFYTIFKNLCLKGGSYDWENHEKTGYYCKPG